MELKEEDEKYKDIFNVECLPVNCNARSLLNTAASACNFPRNSIPVKDTSVYPFSGEYNRVGIRTQEAFNPLSFPYILLQGSGPQHFNLNTLDKAK